MKKPRLFSIIESPTHPDFNQLYRKLGIDVSVYESTRKAINALKTEKPDLVVAEFFYGYGNNYAGVNVCNLDVFLYSLQKYAPEARVIVLVDKQEREFVDKLAALFPLHDVLVQPARESQLEQALLKAIQTEGEGR
jgi:DNA-binding NarL/FixJ family response regulator